MVLCVCVCVFYVSVFPVVKRHRQVLQQLDYCDNSNIKHDAVITLDVCLQPWTDIHKKYKFLYEKYLQVVCILNILTMFIENTVCWLNKICHHYMYSFVGDLPDDGYAKAETCGKQIVEWQMIFVDCAIFLLNAAWNMENIKVVVML